MPPEVEEFYRLFQLFVVASTAAARDIAWKNAITYLVRNPRVYQYVGQSASPQIILAVERQMLKLFAAKSLQRGLQATMGSGMRMYIARLGMNFAVSPKVPVPQAQLALTLAIAIGTMAPVYAEAKSKGAYKEAYDQYRIQYMQRIIKVLEAKPHLADRLSQPLLFDEWYEQNR